MSCAIKICGITTTEDARIADAAGADFLGVIVNVTSSPRSLTVNEAKEIFSCSKIPVILLTYDMPTDKVAALVSELNPFGVQLAGNETSDDILTLRNSLNCEIWKSLHIPVTENEGLKINDIVNKITAFKEAGSDRIVLDSTVKTGSTVQKGGTGRPFDWSLASAITKKARSFLFLAGGINPENVKQAITQVIPDGIDLSSGVEKSVGKKDRHLLKKLITTVRETDASL
jgi:phosphoribosylanthranilate isomerase